MKKTILFVSLILGLSTLTAFSQGIKFEENHDLNAALVKAKAEIKGNQIILEAKEVKTPVFVRYNWSNEAFPDLFNKANLPASVYSNEK